MFYTVKHFNYTIAKSFFLKLFYVNICAVIQIKAYTSIRTLKINNIVDTNSELFLFEPLDYSGNINRGINGNYYTNHYMKDLS